MANYSSVEAYDFSLFESDGNAARVSPAPVLPEQPERSQPSKKNTAPLPHKQTEIRPAVKAATAFFLSVLVLAGCGLLLNRRAKIDMIAADIREIQEEIELEKSDNDRYSSELMALFSKSAVESYAENVLGMVKLDTYNTIQITIPKTDGVVVSGGKETNQEQTQPLPSAPVDPGMADTAADSEADITDAVQSAEG